ncbi:alpha/beta hydrolase [Streptomyces sp. NPDC005393]|uniref:alpha/beta fold hydrolase n=1 Tax=Streptomyces sp. NPDC005393 TaxID=3157041 RepID=UPI0033B9490B
MEQAAALIGKALNATSLLAPRLAGAGAYRVFRLPLKRAAARPAEQEVLADADIGKLSVGGETAVTYRWGSGARPVLLVHGWQSRGSCFARFVPGLLEQGLSPIAFDAPAHGDATGDTTNVLAFQDAILQLSEQYGAFEAIISHSVGVMASALALRSGVRAGRLVAISGVCEFTYLFDQFCDQLALRPRLRAELRGRIERDIFPGEQDIWQRFSAVHRAAELTLPILLFHDENDQRVGMDQARRMATGFGDRARLVTTKGLGHRRILDDPDVVQGALDFVAAARNDGSAGAEAVTR